MFTYRNSLILLFLVPVGILSAQQVASETDPLVERVSLSAKTGELLYANPASNLLRYRSSLSTLEGIYSHADANQPALMQLGDGHHLAGFHTDAYLHFKNNSLVWGEAAYQNGKRKNVKWTETSDFMRVYPYVTADTLGGDFNRESYFFKGGYARRDGRWSYGADMSYSSILEHREIDPRPKNNTVYISATAGVSYYTDFDYQLGGYLYAEKYTQTQDIVFLDPLGSIPVYHMHGLGMHYSRFAGDKMNAYFTGRTFRVGATLQPQHKRGVEAAVQMENFHLQKQLPSLNDAPINDIVEWKMDADVSWKQQNYFVNVKGSYASRMGQERIYDDGVSNWKEISSTKPYSAKHLFAQVSGGYEWRFQRQWNLQALPSVAFNRSEINYKPTRKQVNGGMNTTLAGALNYTKGRHFIALNVGASYYANCMAEQTISNPTYFEFANKMVKHNYDMLTANYWLATTKAVYHYRLNKVISTIYLSASYTHQENDNDYSMNSCTFALGISL